MEKELGFNSKKDILDYIRLTEPDRDANSFPAIPQRTGCPLPRRQTRGRAILTPRQPRRNGAHLRQDRLPLPTGKSMSPCISLFAVGDSGA